MSQIDHWKQLLKGVSAQEGLKKIADAFGPKAKFSSSAGPEDQIITHIIASQRLDIDLFTIDTGRLFQETYDLIDLTRRHYHQNIQFYFPHPCAVESMMASKGPNSFYDSVENRKECCHIRKVAPLKRALTGAGIWITGIRAAQSANRQQMQQVEWDESHQVIKYHPLFHWSQEEVDAFIKDNHVPVNILHNKGYVSIGCAPCTRPVSPGEDPRSGRWWWEGAAKECGLHATAAEKKN